jgi:pyruvate,water dikinase
MHFIRHFEHIELHHAEAVGGKGLSLGLMSRAGLPVPPGFCLTCNAYRAAGDQPQLTETMRTELLEAYRQIGSCAVAVRSSATSEDGTETSFAGQQETVLGVQGEQPLVDAVHRCWQSLHTERARAYRQKQALADDAVAMAVVVQRLVPAEVSGVLFTRDPLDATGQQMLIEAAWGLGESVVSGRVVPDRYHVSRASGELIDQHISTKRTQVTAAGPADVPPGRQSQACLNADQLHQLAELGRRIESFYGDARDVEWAWAEGQFWLLQARPITAAGAFEREHVRREELAALRAKAEPRGTVWAKYNLAEILPAPTPMTWAIVRRFMSGRGGYGLMLRDLGFDPDPIIDEAGFIDLVCGRPYVNLSREPKLYFRDFPSAHPFAALKANPEKAMYPQALPDGERVTARFLLRLPIIMWKMLRNYSLMKRQSQVWAEHLRTVVYPRFVAEVEAERAVELATLPTPELLTRLQRRIDRTLNQFARESLRPSVFAALAMANLEQGLKRTLGPEQAAATVRAALTRVHPDPETDLPAALRQLVEGSMDGEEFLKGFGHRGPQEMELSQPRWSEAPELLPSARPPHPQPLSPEYGGEGSSVGHQPLSPEYGEEGSKLTWDAKLKPDFDLAKTYAGLRESSKHYLMMGYALIRGILVELDCRHQLRGGIFFLTPEELPQLVEGKDVSGLIKDRRQRRQLALSLEVPSVLFSDDLKAIGRPIAPIGATELQGTPLSAGVAEATALVLEEPAAASPNEDGYVLVCPSTDPAWVPLFLRAKALVMESGGVLSHGAIVAREFGLPAVAGIPSIHHRLRTGQRLRVDGNTGKVHVLERAGQDCGFSVA